MKRKMLSRILAAAMAALMLALTGCGGSGSSSSSSTPAAPAAEDGVLRMTAAFADPIDPACTMDSASLQMIVNMYDSLVYPDLDGTILKGAAEDYTISEDGLVYTFTLKENMKFHDGSVVTAQDVVFSYNRMATIGQGYAYLFNGTVASVEAPDEKTVVITLTKPFAPFLSLLCRLYIVNEEVVMANLASGSYGEFGDYGIAYLSQNDAGSGAYVCTNFAVNDRIVIEKFDEYHGTFAENAPEVMELINGTEAATVRTMMANGQLEVSDQWQTYEAYQALGQLDGVELGAYGAGQVLYLMMNTQRAPMDDVHVRRALSYLIDYEQVYSVLFPGYLPVTNYAGDNLAGSAISVDKYAYNMDKALEEFKASKYADQLLNGELAIEVAWVSEVPDEEKLALLIQAAAAQLGVKVEVVKVAWATHVQNTASVESTPHTSVCFMSPNYGEAGSMLYQRLHSDTAGTWEQTEWIQDPELDALIDTALNTIDAAERYALYDQIQQIALDQVYGIAVAEQGEIRAYVDNIRMPMVERGVACTTLGYNFLMKDYQMLDQ